MHFMGYLQLGLLCLSLFLYVGFRMYYARKFGEAAGVFGQVLQLLPKDTVAASFLERCKLYIKNPPPADWSGAVVMTEK